MDKTVGVDRGATAMDECVDTVVSPMNEYSNSRENQANDTVVYSDVIGELLTLLDDLMPGNTDVESLPADVLKRHRST